MYRSKLKMKETQKAIKIVKDNFEKILARTFNLDRVSAPIIVESGKGINDDLGIKNSALRFHVETLNSEIEIVQSLAKWKRIALKRYSYETYEGIYTDMNAIRPLDIVDQTHSLYVDQWDWELIIKDSDRTMQYLKDTVKKIIQAIKATKELVRSYYPVLNEEIVSDVFFITSAELRKMYPNFSLEEREQAITKIHKTVFISQLGLFESKRAPDYDDWLLNGDIIIWSDAANQAIELSSMGIRVNKERLLIQMEESDRLNDLNSKYYQMLLNDEMPVTMGGGIGQSRLCMVLLEKNHIAEVQASIWNDKEHEYFKKKGISPL